MIRVSKGWNISGKLLGSVLEISIWILVQEYKKFTGFGCSELKWIFPWNLIAKMLKTRACLGIRNMLCIPLGVGGCTARDTCQNDYNKPLFSNWTYQFIKHFICETVWTRQHWLNHLVSNQAYEHTINSVARRITIDRWLNKIIWEQWGGWQRNRNNENKK